MTYYKNAFLCLALTASLLCPARAAESASLTARRDSVSREASEIAVSVTQGVSASVTQGVSASVTENVSASVTEVGQGRIITAESGVAAPLTAPRTGKASADNDALWYGYLKSVPDAAQYAGKASADVEQYASVNAGKHLQGFDRKLYDLLKENIRKVAAGGQEETIFRFTASALGLGG